ncbi:MAG: Hsp20/alpha crystallin family protein [Bacteroidales bacterium]|nr:Hsp20/alpha crystallin family protein [Bacteroidales bacterium]
MYPVVRRNQTWLPSIFSDLFDDDFNVMPARQFASPAVNIKETDKEFKIEIAAPGMTKEDFSVRIDNDDELVIALEKKNKKEEKDEKGTNYLRREFSYTSFHQSYTLPENIDLDNIAAEMVNGVLNITLPKKIEEKKVPASRHIEVR